MLYVKARAVAWLGSEPQPGLVEAVMSDATGREWRFVDKDPIFSSERLGAETTFPVDVLIACDEVQRTEGPDG